MDPQVAAHRLTEIAMLLEVRGENPFKSRAFVHAARTIGELEDEDIGPMVRSKEIANLPGIGATTLAVLADLVDTGESEYLDALRENTPKGLVEMMRIPGLGPTRIHRIHEGLGITTVEELERAGRDGRLAKLSGFGVKTSDKILTGIAVLRQTAGQLMHLVAVPEAQRLQKALGRLPGVDRVEVAGALRRTAEVVRDIDLVVESAGVAELSKSAAKVPGVQGLTVVDEQSLTLQLINGARADVYCAPAGRFDVALWSATGSREHCDAVIARLRERGFDVREDTLVDSTGHAVPGADETTIYESAGLTWVPYELRENRGEIEAAAAGKLPELLRPGDLRGVLHCHSKYSDGNATIEKMAEAANARGWSYIGISDHSQAASYAGGMTPDTVKRQHDEIDELNTRLKGFRVLKGIEADMLADGGVDFAGDKIIEQFDYVIGSVHSRFGMAHAQMTERVLKAMSDPRLTIVGHPTGRLLLRREPFPVDIDAMMEMAAEQGIALELNCDPNRLDLDWRLVQLARKRGVTIELGPDAHSPDELGFIDFGIQIARKGWLGAADVLNTRSADDVLSFAKARRNAGGPKATRGS